MMSFFKKPKPRKHCEECRSKGFQDMLNELEDPTKYAGVETVRKYYNNTAISLPSNASHINLVVWEIAKHSPQQVMACIDYFLVVMPPCRKKSFTNTLSAAGIQKMMQSINSCEDERERDGIQSEMFMRLCARVVTYNMDVWGASAAIGQVQSELLREVMLRYLLDPSRAFAKNLAQHKDFVVAFLSLYTTTSIQYPPVKSFLEEQVELYKPKPKPTSTPAIRPGFRQGSLAAKRPMFPMPAPAPATIRATEPAWGGACKRPRIDESTFSDTTTTTPAPCSIGRDSFETPPLIVSESLDCDEFRVSGGSVFLGNPRATKVTVHGTEYTIDSRFAKAGLVVTPDGIFSRGIDVAKTAKQGSLSSSSSSLSDLDVDSDVDSDGDDEFKKALQLSTIAEQERKLAEREKEIYELKKKLQARDPDRDEESAKRMEQSAIDDHDIAECRVCMDAPPAVVYVDCTHMCICAACHMKGNYTECITCRTPITTKPIIPIIVT